MKIRPLHDYVLIKRQQPETTTKSGLIIPNPSPRTSQRGEVLAVGPGKFKKGSSERIPPTLKPGDVVVFSRAANVHRNEIGEDEDGGDLLMLHEDEIAGLVEEP